MDTSVRIYIWEVSTDTAVSTHWKHNYVFTLNAQSHFKVNSQKVNNPADQFWHTACKDLNHRRYRNTGYIV